MKKRTAKGRVRPTMATVRALEAKVKRFKVAHNDLRDDVHRLTSENQGLRSEWRDTRYMRPTVRAANVVIKAREEALVIAEQTIDNLRKGFDIISERRVAKAHQRVQDSKGPLISEYEPNGNEEALLSLGYRVYEIKGHQITVRTLSQMGYA
jgi:predicted RNase H-like nuclease (RuvC/YqgF family)